MSLLITGFALMLVGAFFNVVLGTRDKPPNYEANRWDAAGAFIFGIGVGCLIILVILKAAGL